MTEHIVQMSNGELRFIPRTYYFELADWYLKQRFGTTAGKYVSVSSEKFSSKFIISGLANSDRVLVCIDGEYQYVKNILSDQKTVTPEEAMLFILKCTPY